MPEKQKIIAVVGPTASGKTSLGIEIAKKYRGEVVSADSMQIYKNMPIASAAPTAYETGTINHYMVGFVEPVEKFSVAKYVKLAADSIEKILCKGKLPIIVGGTGLYVDSLISGLSFQEEHSSDIRQALEQEADRIGMEAMLKKVESIDPVSASKLHINDRKRIIRALEIFYMHGKTKTQMDKEALLNESKYDALWIGITYRNREILYERINSRVDLMLEKGLVEEAQIAYKGLKSDTSVQAIGHKEFFPYFKGQTTLDEAVEHLKTETRRYAKRQLTWFRKNKKINWIYADETSNIAGEAFKIIDERGYKP